MVQARSDSRRVQSKHWQGEQELRSLQPGEPRRRRLLAGIRGSVLRMGSGCGTVPRREQSVAAARENPPGAVMSTGARSCRSARLRDVFSRSTRDQGLRRLST